MSAAELQHAAELLDRLVPQATPGPWRDSSVEGNQYAALVSDACTRRCDEWAARYNDGKPPPAWMSHPHDGYGGCLVAESQTAQDRRLMAVMRNVAEHLPGLLRAIAEEDPIEAGRTARRVAVALVDTHRPRTEP